jgi:hypothetical protein
VAFNGQHAAFIECKWRNQLLGYDAYQELVQKAEQLEFEQKRHYFLFAKKGFKKTWPKRTVVFSPIRNLPEPFVIITH